MIKSEPFASGIFISGYSCLFYYGISTDQTGKIFIEIWNTLAALRPGYAYICYFSRFIDPFYRVFGCKSCVKRAFCNEYFSCGRYAGIFDSCCNRVNNKNKENGSKDCHHGKKAEGYGRGEDRHKKMTVRRSVIIFREG